MAEEVTEAHQSTTSSSNRKGDISEIHDISEISDL